MGALPYLYDVFYIAAHSGSVDALQTLLAYYSIVIDSTQGISFEERGFLLLNVAAESAQIEVVQFLLNNQPLYADIHARDGQGYTAIASAANVYETKHSDSFNWQDASFDRNETVMNLLLDRGACVSDAVLSLDDTFESSPDTVLTLAAQWAGPELIKRLIDGGADVHAKVKQDAEHFIFNDRRSYVLDVRALFIARLHANANAVKVLLSYRGIRIDTEDMICSRDSRGSLPLHRATRNRLPIEVSVEPLDVEDEGRREAV